MAEAETKKAMRKEMLWRRNAQDAGVAARRSRLAQASLLHSEIWRKATSVALYMPVKGETGTELLLSTALATGKKTYLPRIADPATRTMTFCPCHSPDELRPGQWGIPEPMQTGPEPVVLDLLVLPGLAFDLTGARLGYGGGYYDRYLSGHPEFAKQTVGLCFAFQIVASVPECADDWPLAGLCSEEGMIWV